jgi:hypothetical protein
MSSTNAGDSPTPPWASAPARPGPRALVPTGGSFGSIAWTPTPPPLRRRPPTSQPPTTCSDTGSDAAPTTTPPRPSSAATAGASAVRIPGRLATPPGPARTGASNACGGPSPPRRPAREVELGLTFDQAAPATTAVLSVEHEHRRDPYTGTGTAPAATVARRAGGPVASLGAQAASTSGPTVHAAVVKVMSDPRPAGPAPGTGRHRGTPDGRVRVRPAWKPAPRRLRLPAATSASVSCESSRARSLRHRYRSTPPPSRIARHADPRTGKGGTDGQGR